MVNERCLRETLIAFAEENRTNHILVVSLVNELAALRETVRGLDPTFGDVMERRRAEAEARGVEIAETVLAGFDRTIQKLKDGYVC